MPICCHMLLSMIGQIKVFSNWFRCVFGMQAWPSGRALDL